MRIRTKITLWTGCLALVVAVCFSVFVFFDLVEQPFRLIDRELRDLSETLDQTVLMAVNHSQSIAQNELSSSHFSRFWIKVVDDDSKILFETPLARKADIPLRPDKLFYFEKVGIPLNQLWIAQEDLDEFADLSSEQTVFRVMASRRIIGDHGYRLLVAKPIPVLINELKELGVDLAVGIVICIIVAAFASYYLAGKILSRFQRSIT